MLNEAEIIPGLVLHLDPDTLENEGGTYTCTKSLRVQHGHFFLCLSATDTTGRWLPLYSEDGDGREKLGPDGRSGHSKWTKGTTYWHPAQVWTASHAAVVAAATDGGDMSRAGSRNTLDVSKLPKIP